MSSTPASPATARPLLWLGLALMCLAVALTAFLYFLFLLSVPLWIVGFVLVLKSGYSPGWKALALAFPFVAWVGIAAGAWATAPREQPTTYLVPEGFEGTVLILKNEPCAPAPEREDGRLRYRVPTGGLLLTRDTVPNRQHPFYDWPNRGYFLRPDNRYYVVDRQGRRLRELTEVHPATESTGNPEPTSSLGTVGRDEVVAFYEAPMEQFADTFGHPGYAFQYLTITTQNRYELVSQSPASFRLRSLADSLLPRCRAGVGGRPPAPAQPGNPPAKRP